MLPEKTDERLQQLVALLPTLSEEARKRCLEEAHQIVIGLLMEAHSYRTLDIPIHPFLDIAMPEGMYVSLFKNGNGEQMIFTREKDATEAILWHSYEGWRQYGIVSAETSDPLPAKRGWYGEKPLFLSHPEKTWIRSCWEASSR